MRMHQYSKLGVIACIAIFAASVQVRAADMAWASGALADIYVAMTEANFAKASAADSPTAVAKAQEQLDNVGEAAKAALAAYKEMEAAGEGDAAEADSRRDGRCLLSGGHHYAGGQPPVRKHGGYRRGHRGGSGWFSPHLAGLCFCLLSLL